MGNSVNISRRYDVVPRSVWSWMEDTSVRSGSTEATPARECVDADASKESYEDLLDVPFDIFKNRPVERMAAWAETPPVARERGQRPPRQPRSPRGATGGGSKKAMPEQQPRYGHTTSPDQGSTCEPEEAEEQDEDDPVTPIAGGGRGLTVAELAQQLSGGLGQGWQDAYSSPSSSSTALGASHLLHGGQRPWPMQATARDIATLNFAAAQHAAAAAAQHAPLAPQWPGPWRSDLENQRLALAAAITLQRQQQLEAGLQYQAATAAAQAAAWAAASQKAANSAAATERARAAAAARAAAPLGGLGAAPRGLGAAPLGGYKVGVPPLAGLDRDLAPNLSDASGSTTASSDGGAALEGAEACGADRAVVDEEDADCTTE